MTTSKWKTCPSAMRTRRVDAPAVRPPAARLISRLYRAASAPLRSKMLACLVRPLGSLGLAAVASGAFADLLQWGSEAGANIPFEDVARYSSDQVFELARFVEQVNPDAIQQVAGLLADNPVSASAFGAAVVILLVRAVQRLGPKAAPRSNPADAGGVGSSSREKVSTGHGSDTALHEMVHRARERPEPDPMYATVPIDTRSRWRSLTRLHHDSRGAAFTGSS